LREQAVSAPAASAAATLGLAHCLIRDARANRASAILTRLLPSLQGSERWHALLLDAQAQTVLARYDTAIARAREVGVAAAAMDAKALRARALTVEAEAGLLAGKQAEAARANDEAAALLRTLGDPGGAAIAEQKGTMLTLVVQDPARAEALLREHLTLAGELGEPVLAAQSRRLISAAQKAQGRLAESRTMLEQALAGYVALGDRQWQAKIDVNLAMRDQLEGDFSGAEARVRDALDAFPAQGYERAFVQAEKAYILRSQGRFEDALRAIEVAFETAATMRSESRILQVRCERSAILSSLGRIEEALADLQSCARFDRIEAGLEPAALWVTYALIRRAEIDAVSGRAAAAREAWETAVAGIGGIGNPATRAAMQIEAIQVGIVLGVETQRLQALRPQVSAEMVALDLRTRMADALLRRTRGDAGSADALAEIGDRIHPSDWSTRSWWLVLQAARDPAPWRGAGAETLRAEATRRADARMIALLDAFARAESGRR
jgi:tetratricopeptide (TPR) repeat protein